MTKEFFTFLETDKEISEDSLPSYSKPGCLLVEILGPSPTGVYKYEYEVHDHDSDSSVYWVNNGMGFDYWLDLYCEFPGVGFYVIEGIVGSYHRGEWGFSDDDEDWEYTIIRPATNEEISTLTFYLIEEV
jgi:hypothetical protein